MTKWNCALATKLTRKSGSRGTMVARAVLEAEGQNSRNLYVYIYTYSIYIFICLNIYIHIEPDLRIAADTMGTKLAV